MQEKIKTGLKAVVPIRKSQTKIHQVDDVVCCLLATPSLRSYLFVSNFEWQAYFERNDSVKYHLIERQCVMSVFFEALMFPCSFSIFKTRVSESFATIPQHSASTYIIGAKSLCCFLYYKTHINV